MEHQGVSPGGQDGAVEILTLSGPKARKMNEQGPRAPEARKTTGWKKALSSLPL